MKLANPAWSEFLDKPNSAPGIARRNAWQGNAFIHHRAICFLARDTNRESATMSRENTHVSAMIPVARPAYPLRFRIAIALILIAHSSARA